MEFLFNLLFEGLAGVAGSPKIPAWVRIMFATIFFVPLVALMTVVGVFVLKNIIFGAVMCWLFALILLSLWILTCRKIIKTKKTPPPLPLENEENQIDK